MRIGQRASTPRTSLKPDQQRERSWASLCTVDVSTRDTGWSLSPAVCVPAAVTEESPGFLGPEELNLKGGGRGEHSATVCSTGITQRCHLLLSRECSTLTAACRPPERSSGLAEHPERACSGWSLCFCCKELPPSYNKDRICGLPAWDWPSQKAALSTLWAERPVPGDRTDCLWHRTGRQGLGWGAGIHQSLLVLHECLVSGCAAFCVFPGRFWSIWHSLLKKVRSKTHLLKVFISVFWSVFAWKQHHSSVLNICMISVFHLLKSGIRAEPIWSGYLRYPENMSKKAVDLPVCRLALTYAHILKTEEMKQLSDPLTWDPEQIL